MKNFFTKIQYLCQQYVGGEAHKKAVVLENTLLQSIFYHVQGCLYFKDAQGVYRAVSGGCEKNFLASSKHTVIGCRDDDLYDDHTVKILAKQDKAVLKNQHSIVCDVDIKVNNCVIAHKVIKTAIYDAKHTLLGILTEYIMHPRPKFLAPISDDSDQLILSFIRDMEHDLRTPLSGILGLVRILYAQEHDAEYQEYLRLIMLSTEEVIYYCQNILAYSKMSRDLYPTVLKSFACEDMLEKIMTMQLPAAINKSLVLSIEKAQDVPKNIKTDAYRFEKILINLIGNSIKHTDQGCVTVKVSWRILFRHHSVMCVTIEDTGRGMPENIRDYLQQAQPDARADVSDSIGMGLQIVRGFVDDLGGDIQVTSRAQGGSSIYLEIPMQNMDDRMLHADEEIGGNSG